MSDQAKNFFEEELMNEKELRKSLSYINFKLLNTLSLQSKQDRAVVMLFKSLLTIFMGCENWIPKVIKDWPTIQRTIGHTSKFIQMLQNFKKYHICESNLLQAHQLLQEVPLLNLTTRAMHLLNIVRKLLEYYLNPFNASLNEDSQLTKKFYNNDDTLLSPIITVLEQDSEILSMKKEKMSTTPNLKVLRSRSPTTTSSGSKSRTLCRFSIEQRQQSLTRTAFLKQSIKPKESGMYVRERSSTNTKQRDKSKQIYTTKQ